MCKQSYWTFGFCWTPQAKRSLAFLILTYTPLPSWLWDQVGSAVDCNYVDLGFESERALACGLGFHSLPDCIGFPPTSKTELFYHPVFVPITVGCVIKSMLSGCSSSGIAFLLSTNNKNKNNYSTSFLYHIFSEVSVCECTFKTVATGSRGCPGSTRCLLTSDKSVASNRQQIKK